MRLGCDTMDRDKGFYMMINVQHNNTLGTQMQMSNVTIKVEHIN